MINYFYPKIGIKLIFTTVSFLLLLPLYLSPNANFYRTVFIGHIGITIDLVFNDSPNRCIFFSVWETINTITSVLVCSFSFGCMVDNFLQLCSPYLQVINIVLIGILLSCLSKNFADFCFKTYQIKLAKDKLISMQER